MNHLNATLHFIRPYWLFALLPWCAWLAGLILQKRQAHAWDRICDPHLLMYLIKKNHGTRMISPDGLLLMSALFMIIGLSGPSFSKKPTPVFETTQARVVLLDLSEDMLLRDLSPNRLTRAKFKLHDLFQRQDAGQFGLIAYTAMPFTASPLTTDGQTIDALLPALSPDVMPIDGNELDRALEAGALLIKEASLATGNLLVLTATAPSTDAIRTAHKLTKQGISTSILSLQIDHADDVAFQSLANAGKGLFIALQETDADLNQWLTQSNAKLAYAKHQALFSTWNDQGRWFLIPALCLFLPVFRSGWFHSGGIV